MVFDVQVVLARSTLSRRVAETVVATSGREVITANPRLPMNTSEIPVFPMILSAKFERRTPDHQTSTAARQKMAVIHAKERFCMKFPMYRLFSGSWIGSRGKEERHPLFLVVQSYPLPLVAKSCLTKVYVEEGDWGKSIWYKKRNLVGFLLVILHHHLYQDQGHHHHHHHLIPQVFPVFLQ